jgi:phosphate transporter
MKFTHVLKFNAVPEWKEHYINYPVLKKLLTQAHQAEAEGFYEGIPAADEEAGSRTPLLSQALSPSISRQGSTSTRAFDSEFVKQLDQELSKIITFYLRKEAELLGQYESFSFRMHSLEGLPSPPPETTEGLATPERVAFWSASKPLKELSKNIDNSLQTSSAW